MEQFLFRDSFTPTDRPFPNFFYTHRGICLADPGPGRLHGVDPGPGRLHRVASARDSSANKAEAFYRGFFAETLLHIDPLHRVTLRQRPIFTENLKTNTVYAGPFIH